MIRPLDESMLLHVTSSFPEGCENLFWTGSQYQKYMYERKERNSTDKNVNENNETEAGAPCTDCSNESEHPNESINQLEEIVENFRK